MLRSKRYIQNELIGIDNAKKACGKSETTSFSVALLNFGAHHRFGRSGGTERSATKTSFPG
jgi:hypothetical protein